MYLAYAILVLLVCTAIWAAIHWYWSQKSETDLIKLRMKQAAKTKWKKTAEVKEDRQGAPWTQRSVHFARGKDEAVLWYKDATITLVRLNVPFDFDGFIELEEFIVKHPREHDIDDAIGELKYLREMELFVIRHGYRDDLMHIQATDIQFLTAFGKLFKAGYAANEESVVIAALVLDGILRYKKDPNGAVNYLTRLIDDIHHQKESS
jgi:hypothetical protein